MLVWPPAGQSWPHVVWFGLLQSSLGSCREVLASCQSPSRPPAGQSGFLQEGPGRTPAGQPGLPQGRKCSSFIKTLSPLTLFLQIYEGKWDIKHFQTQLWVLMTLIHCGDSSQRGKNLTTPNGLDHFATYAMQHTGRPHVCNNCVHSVWSWD